MCIYTYRQHPDCPHPVERISFLQGQRCPDCISDWSSMAPAYAAINQQYLDYGVRTNYDL